jgi:hypothetical protein
MLIEIVEFYPDKVNLDTEYFNGTLHVYLVDYEIDLRGVYVYRKNEKWMFRLPTKISKDEEEITRYPIFNFTDPNKNRELITEIRKAGISYIRKQFVELFDAI